MNCLAFLCPNHVMTIKDAKRKSKMYGLKLIKKIIMRCKNYGYPNLLKLKLQFLAEESEQIMENQR